MPASQTASSAAAREVLGFALILALIAMFAAGKAVLYDTLDPDAFWHLRVAERIAQVGPRPLIDDLSFASLKQPWTPYSWLGELGMKWLWDRGQLRWAIIAQAMLTATIVVMAGMTALELLRARD